MSATEKPRLIDPGAESVSLFLNDDPQFPPCYVFYARDSSSASSESTREYVRTLRQISQIGYYLITTFKVHLRFPTDARH
ncbi:MAG: hypothetical protein WCH43_16560 [Verrucomicrobiota bacterium]